MFKGPPESSPVGVILRKQDAVSHFIQCECDESVEKKSLPAGQRCSYMQFVVKTFNESQHLCKELIIFCILRIKFHIKGAFLPIFHLSGPLTACLHAGTQLSCLIEVE